MKTYQNVASKWKAENKGWYKANVWLNTEAHARCVALGLFQGRTPNEPEAFTPRGKRRKQGR